MHVIPLERQEMSETSKKSFCKIVVDWLDTKEGGMDNSLEGLGCSCLQKENNTKRVAHTLMLEAHESGTHCALHGLRSNFKALSGSHVHDPDHRRLRWEPLNTRVGGR
jgi:hypothetical protein